MIWKLPKLSKLVYLLLIAGQMGTQKCPNEESDHEEVGAAPITAPASAIRACQNPPAERLVIGLLYHRASKRNACPQKDGVTGLILCRIAFEFYLSTEDITNLGSSAQALLRPAFNP